MITKKRVYAGSTFKLLLFYEIDNIDFDQNLYINMITKKQMYVRSTFKLLLFYEIDKIYFD